MNKKKVIILGSTGSIGVNTLDVIRHLPDLFEVAALSCRKSIKKLKEQMREFFPQAVAVTGEEHRNEILPEICDTGFVRLYRGETGLLQMIEELDADIVVNGISGSKGLLPSLKTLEVGMNLSIANKETIVMAGPLIMEAARKSGVNLIPIDSEHFAIFNLLKQIRPENVDQVILTASGGAFRDLPYERWKDIRVQDALKHPNWDMGVKNTVDSATMANKGLEFIEAHYLFDIEVSRIKVVIHPQSYIHSLIRTIDGFMYAQISQPDMRMVIQNTLTYPELCQASFGTMDLLEKEFSFYPVDKKKYILLHLAYQAAEREGAYPIVYNAANEVALEYFLNETIAFIEIPVIVEETLNSQWSEPAEKVEEILEIDQMARSKAIEIIKKRKRTAS